MAGPALALQYLLIFGFYAFLLLLLLYTIIIRKTLKKSIPLGFLFLTLTGFAIYCNYQNNNDEYEASKKFRGDYKLVKLDGHLCDQCKVRLNDDYRYDILVNDEIVGHGKWHIETAIDIPGAFLKLENGPPWVIWEQDRQIDFIDRRQN